VESGVRTADELKTTGLTSAFSLAATVIDTPLQRSSLALKAWHRFQAQKTDGNDVDRADSKR
jgi:hypothetical protein